MRRLSVLLCTVVLCAACSEPPHKEMNRAQGAIDAARAAGAERYAPDLLGAATTALQQSHDAVDQRDYRLALSRALDAGDRAQEAAKQAADNKAKTRSESETAINATSAALEQLEATLKEASAARVPAPVLARARKVDADAGASLQKARAALGVGNYIEAGAVLKNKTGEMTAQISTIENAIEARTARTAKRKR